MCICGDAGALEHLAGAAAQGDRRRAARLVPHLDVAPTDAADPAGAERLEHRFLRRPAAGVVLRGRLLGRAVLDLVLGVDAADEQLAVPLDHLRDPQALDDVGADADDLRAAIVSSPSRRTRLERGPASAPAFARAFAAPAFSTSRTSSGRAAQSARRSRAAPKNASAASASAFFTSP